MGIQIYGNIDADGIGTGKVQSINNLSLSPMRDLVLGDSQDVEIFLTSKTGIVNIQDYSVRLAIGTANAKPTGGTWRLGQTTGIAYNVSAGDLQSAITTNSAANTTTELAPFTFKTVFSANGLQTIPTIDATGLTPSSSVSITKLVVGDGSTKEQWLTRIFRNPLTLQDSFTNFTKTGVGEGIFGSLSIGTPEIFDEFTTTITTVSSTLELEVTDTNGNANTIFQVPVDIISEVIGAGISVSSLTPSTFQTATDVNTTIDSVTTLDKQLFVSEARGNDATGTRNSTTKPYLTLAGAYADAQTNDTIVLLDGDFSGESTLSINKALNFHLSEKVVIGNITSTAGSGTTRILGLGVFARVGQLDFSGASSITVGLSNIYATLYKAPSSSNTRATYCTFGGVNDISLSFGSGVTANSYFKDCIISSSGNCSIDFNECTGDFLFENCNIGNFLYAGDSIKFTNTTAVPATCKLKDSVVSVGSASYNAFVRTSSATTPEIDFIGGSSELSYFANESDFTVNGNYILDTRSGNLPVVLPS